MLEQEHLADRDLGSERRGSRIAEADQPVVKAFILTLAGHFERFQAVGYDTDRHVPVRVDEVGELERSVNILSPGFQALI